MGSKGFVRSARLVKSILMDNQEWPMLFLKVQAPLVYACHPTVPYMLTGLARCSVSPEISCGVRKLTRTHRVLIDRLEAHWATGLVLRVGDPGGLGRGPYKWLGLNHMMLETLVEEGDIHTSTKVMTGFPMCLGNLSEDITQDDAFLDGLFGLALDSPQRLQSL
ncbi:hypothetical protein NC653_032973 [Populus alba x Populus x berolinensis]|uniref:Uncharacterized protein n=1 Tax=Populus alba x Populus x berolinensis TaxID=444605 RepID=A0AAD6LSK7_9ROSI|nr:hypothetical protein NC653_032973 [Populus alba x Populus x berolinensis]